MLLSLRNCEITSIKCLKHAQLGAMLNNFLITVTILFTIHSFDFLFAIQSNTIIVHTIFSKLFVLYNDLCIILVF